MVHCIRVGSTASSRGKVRQIPPMGSCLPFDQRFQLVFNHEFMYHSQGPNRVWPRAALKNEQDRVVACCDPPCSVRQHVAYTLQE